MVEKAIFISQESGLEYVTDEYSRIYFGVEFCERLIPSPQTLSSLFTFARERNKAITFVTPFVTDKGLVRLEECFDFIACQDILCEIIVNDWGVLRLVHARKWQGGIALGRLLTKQKRGPRIQHIADKIPEAALDHFRQSNVDVPDLTDFLRSQGVSRVEFDNVLQGIARPQAVLKGSLYYPYVYVTTTRYCVFASYANGSRSLRTIAPCNKECLRSSVALTHRSMPVELILKGNTQFFKNETISNDLETLAIDRLVFEPEIPL